MFRANSISIHLRELLKCNFELICAVRYSTVLQKSIQSRRTSAQLKPLMLTSLVEKQQHRKLHSLCRSHSNACPVLSILQVLDRAMMFHFSPCWTPNSKPSQVKYNTAQHSTRRSGRPETPICSDSIFCRILNSYPCRPHHHPRSLRRSRWADDFDVDTCTHHQHRTRLCRHRRALRHQRLCPRCPQLHTAP